MPRPFEVPITSTRWPACEEVGLQLAADLVLARPPRASTRHSRTQRRGATARLLEVAEHGLARAIFAAALAEAELERGVAVPFAASGSGRTAFGAGLEHRHRDALARLVEDPRSCRACGTGARWPRSLLRGRCGLDRRGQAPKRRGEGGGRERVRRANPARRCATPARHPDPGRRHRARGDRGRPAPCSRPPGVAIDWDRRSRPAPRWSPSTARPLPEGVLHSIRTHGVALKGPIGTPDRRRLPERERDAPPVARPLRLGAAGEEHPGRAVALRRRRPDRGAREHRGPLLGARAPRGARHRREPQGRDRGAPRCGSRATPSRSPSAKGAARSAPSTRRTS